MALMMSSPAEDGFDRMCSRDRSEFSVLSLLYNLGSECRCEEMRDCDYE
jgi:hypothetical protein